MKKIYSFVLMAAMLLVGTSAWATKVAEMTKGGQTTDVEDLYTALASVGNETATITLVAPATLDMAVSASEVANQKVFILNGGQNITLDLAGFNLTDLIRINVANAKLRVINSSATKSQIYATTCNVNRGSQPFNTYGVSGTDATVARDACYFLLGENVSLNVKSYGVAVMYYGAFKYATDADKADGKPTYGATVDIQGEVHASEGTAIATNGTMNFKGNGQDKTKCPLINITSTAKLYGSNELETIVANANGDGEQKAVAAAGKASYKTTSAAVYGPGYAEWNIAGLLEGGVGLYLKSGKYSIANAKIHATAAEYWEPIEYNNGFIGAGCAIIFDNNKNYGGDVTATITGAQTEVSTSVAGGYSILDTETTDDNGVDETAVSDLSIADGTFTGDFNTTAELKEDIEINGAITGGTYKGENITEILNNMAGVEATETAPGSGVYVVKVSVDVTLNAAGLATFSARKAVRIPASSGLVAYKTTGLDGDKLGLSVVAEQDEVIPADKGVLLYKENAAGAQFKLEEVSENSAANYDGNLFRPATAFDAAVEAGDKIYVLHGSELWVFDGDQFPANKAFLHLDLGNNAPARIRLVFDAVEGVENVEFEAVKAEKFIENGQVLIKRGEKVYNVQGQIVK